MAKTEPVAHAKPDEAERISSLMDGELDQAQADALIAALLRDKALLRHWHEFQRVGDALRSSEVAGFDSPAFCSRVAAALADEPTVLAPPRRAPARRWVLPGVAVAASVAALGFIALPMLERPASPNLAASPAVVAAPVVATAPVAAESVQTTPVRRMAPGSGLDVYLTAHRELTGGTAMPRAAHYLRPAVGEER